MQYKIGDKVIVTANSANEITAWHSIQIGTRCTIGKVLKSDYYLLQVDGKDLIDVLHNQDFRPIDQINGKG